MSSAFPDLEGSILNPRPVREMIRPVTPIESLTLSRKLNADVLLASETFQHTGSFKFRGAFHLVSQVANSHIITTCCGNFGHALAFACKLTQKSCTVVMSQTAMAGKMRAVRTLGGQLDVVDPALTERRKRTENLARNYPRAYLATADDPYVLAGATTLGLELAALPRHIDLIVAPIGGGSLAAGILRGLQRAGKSIPVLGVVPAQANVFARSMRAGRIVGQSHEPDSIADCARTLSVGLRNWDILRSSLSKVVEVSEEQIRKAVRLLFTHANLKAEPSGALCVAALLSQPHLFHGRSVCCVVSGGNVDSALFRRILAERLAG